jgi:aspartate 1-decarboxylase
LLIPFGINEHKPNNLILPFIYSNKHPFIFLLYINNKKINFAIMMIEVMKSKIHRARVTQAELNYVGSITIDEDLMDAADIIANEKVQIVNNNNGARLETYVIPGERGTGTICLNGAAARLVQVGDIVIIISYATMDREEARKHKPSLVFPDDHNRLLK